MIVYMNTTCCLLPDLARRRKHPKRSALAGGCLRALRGAFALILGAEAVPAHHPARGNGITCLGWTRE